LFTDRSDSGSYSIAERAASGATPARIFYEDAGKPVFPLDESVDGKWLVLAIGNPGGRASG
jgi:hypothetical protein